ncbi:MAG: hypothetical protein RLZZ600_1168, partial [Actinomycetota bacterium]
RLLHESIPLDRMALDQLIAGWFTAQAFAMLIKGAEEGGLGPKLGIYDTSGAELWFPHPLLYSGTRLQTIDFLGAVVESTIIAPALANAQNSMDPLKAYQRLINLGEQGLAPEIRAWIERGKAIPGNTAPTSIANKPEAGIDVESRKALMRNFIENQLTKLREKITEVAETSSVYDLPNVWEILPQIEHAVARVIHEVNAITVIDDLDDTGFTTV